MNASSYKKHIEILIMPLTITVIGTISTYLITSTQLETAKEIAKAERQIKLLEIYIEKISSKENKDVNMAINILNLIDKEFSTKLGEIILKDTSYTLEQKKIVKEILSEHSSKSNYFVVVFSSTTLSEAFSFAKKVKDTLSDFSVEIFQSENRYYAVTIGSYLSYEEAKAKSRLAKQFSTTKGAYIRNSDKWGKNLFNQ